MSKKTITKGEDKKKPSAKIDSSNIKNTRSRKTTSSKAKVTNSKSASTKTKTVKPSSKNKATADFIEYYDLPNRYNKTMVKVLFQTPKKLFVYWEISENDKEKCLKNFGQDFFETTSPFLVVRNKSKNYSFEIEINDFANSWYFNVPDSNCEYEVELIRKNKVTNVPTQIMKSNNLEVPNNHILFEQNRKEIFFKNVKSNTVTSKSIVNLHFMNHVGNAYLATNFYNKFYTQKDLEEITNPTSN